MVAGCPPGHPPGQPRSAGEDRGAGGLWPLHARGAGQEGGGRGDAGAEVDAAVMGKDAWEEARTCKGLPGRFPAEQKAQERFFAGAPTSLHPGVS